MTDLVACDLDRTLIWSWRTLAQTRAEGQDPPLVCVEQLRGREHSFVTERAADVMEQVAATGSLVVVTTRTPEQLQRLRLPTLPYVLCLNGGRLLVDGAEEPGFAAEVADRLATVASHAQMGAGLADVCDVPFVRQVRDAGLFFYVDVTDEEPPDGWSDALARTVADGSWVLTLERLRYYCTPAPLTKAWAVGRLLDRLDARLALAAGDSFLDAEMLTMAGEARVPRDSYLDAAGWRAPRVEVTAAAGVLAGEEILDWVHERLRAGRPKKGAPR